MAVCKIEQMAIKYAHDHLPLQDPFFKEVARGGERTRVLSISFIFSFSSLYR
jgi:hypothetical protein